jgi:putative DNA primase/helicase
MLDGDAGSGSDCFPKPEGDLDLKIDASEKTIKRWHTELSRKISQLRGNAGRKNVVEYARTCPDASLVIDGEELDSDPWLLACANGVLELRTGELRPGRPEDFLTCASPTQWRGLSEPCPAFEKFMSDILGGNQELVDYMRRMLGHALIGEQRERVFLVLSGAQGQNGKGTLMNILGHVLGPDVMVPVPAEMLLDQGFTKSSSGPSPDIMSLRGRRLAHAEETDEGRRISSSRVKQLSGGGRLAARGTYDLEMSYWDQTHTLILLTNDLPHARADDQAFWYRVHVVRFLYSFVSSPNPNNAFERLKDNDLERKLKSEASGILAWLVRGCLEYLKTGLAPPDEVTEATRSYRAAEDLVGRFLAECCEVREGLETKASVLYDNFRWWYGHEVSRKREFSNVKFAETLKKRGFEKEKKSAHYWLNIALTEDFLEERKEAEERAESKKGGLL